MKWHFIGHLQTNKAKKAVRLFNCIQTLDSPRLADCLQQEAQQQDLELDVLLQVNIAEEKSKFGSTMQELELLIEAVNSASNLRCKGMMIIPPYFDKPDEVRYYFRSLRELAEKYRSSLRSPDDFTELSMGMSHDFSVSDRRRRNFDSNRDSNFWRKRLRIIKYLLKIRFFFEYIRLKYP